MGEERTKTTARGRRSNNAHTYIYRHPLESRTILTPPPFFTRSQNENLKDIIRKECPGRAEELLAKNTQEGGRAASSYTPLPMPSGFGPVKTLMEPGEKMKRGRKGRNVNCP
jgi:hypothetical protein